uniref:p60 n=1 Tax=Strawberry pallidosis-associated virus TaxID=227507 RepID=A0A7G9U714_9CLOS|nr:p60 [Strawberry pallidosis-associated virus]
MVDLVENRSVDRFLTFFFKRKDVRKEKILLHDYLLRNYSTENNNNYRVQTPKGVVTYSSNYTVRNGRVLVSVDDTGEIIKLAIIYMYKINPALLRKTAFRPENFFTDFNWSDSEREVKDFYDLSMNEYLNAKKSLGCTFNDEDIRKRYPNADEIRQLTLYRVCNSQGKYVDESEIGSGTIKGFEISTKADGGGVGEGISSNPLFLRCVEVFRKYLSLNNSKVGKAKIDANKKIFEVYLNSLRTSQDTKKLESNPLVISYFISEFDRLTEKSKGFKDNFEALKELTPGFVTFIKDVFKLSGTINENKLFFDLPKSSIVDILSEPAIISEQLLENIKVDTESCSNTLPYEIDKFVCGKILEFFSGKSGMNEKDIFDCLLFIFGRYTTNPKRLCLPEDVSVTFKQQTLKFRVSDFNSSVCNAVYNKFPEFKGMNIIRLWSNARASRAMLLFKSSGFNPGLFSYIPKIPNYMRFDFFKSIPLKDMSEEEVKAFRTLRVLTESHSEKTEDLKQDCTRWILNQL